MNGPGRAFAMSARSLAVLFSLFLALTSASDALATDRLIKLAHPNRNDPQDNATGAMAVVFKRLVEAGSKGAIHVDIYPEGQVGQDDAAVALVRKGVIESAISSEGGIAQGYPLITVVDVPFAYPTINSTYAVFDGPFGLHLGEDISRVTGLHVLGFGDSGGFFALTNSVRQIRSPADVAGLKIRTMGLESHRVFVRSLGAEPASIAWGEVYTALQTGVADGQMNPISVIQFGRLDEVQKYLTLTNHLFAPYVWVMNGDFWRELSPQEQGLVGEAAHSAIAAGRKLNRFIESSDRGLPALQQRMNVYAPDEAQIAAFRAVSQAAVEGYIAKTFGSDGAALMHQFLDAVRSAPQQ